MRFVTFLSSLAVDDSLFVKGGVILRHEDSAGLDRDGAVAY